MSHGRAPDFYWNGRPVYRCLSCGSGYERVENLDAVLRHEAETHKVVELVRESAIVGADGKPLLVAEKLEA